MISMITNFGQKWSILGAGCEQFMIQYNNSHEYFTARSENRPKTWQLNKKIVRARWFKCSFCAIKL